jgi:exopolysaccharide biosynthesis polyprenyl glycosylphosphotransferase
MKPHWYGRWRALAFSLDLAFVGAALSVWTMGRFGLSALPGAFVPSAGQGFGRAPLAFAIPAWLAVFGLVRLYSPQRCQNALEQGRRLLIAGPGAALGTIFLGFLVKQNPSRSWLVGALVIGTLAAAVGRQTLRSIVDRHRAKGRWTTPTVVVGGAEAKRILEIGSSDPGVGLEPVATCGFGWGTLPEWPVNAVGAAVRAAQASELLVVAEDLTRSQVRAAIEATDDLPVSVVVLPGLDHLLLGSLRMVTVGYEPGIALESRSLQSYQRAIKRVIDVFVGSLVLVLSAPIMAIVALAIRVESPGPVLFRHKREGYRGAAFEVLKFRTMHAGVEDTEPVEGELGFGVKPEDDPRTTRLGRFLRRTSLDELPQLWNVVRGEMSLVGPRPLSLWEAERLGLERRMIVRPGLTGLWQVSGRSTLSPVERVRLDIVYVQNWSLLLDLSILLRTVPAVVGRRGAY